MDQIFPVYSKSQLVKNLQYVSKILKEDRSKLSLECSRRKILHAIINSQRYLVFTTYFVTKRDPQGAPKSAPKNDIKYIAPWYQSINSLQLHGIVFHDDLSSDFIELYTTEYVSFVQCQLGPYSLNDERFFIYYDYILHYCQNLEYVLMTDGNDVQIKKDPFELFRRYNDQVLFVGRNNGNLIRQSEFNKERIGVFQEDRKAPVEANFYNLPIYNAGILGGSIGAVIYFLKQFLFILEGCNSDRNHNMVALNYTIFKYWYPKIMRGCRPIIGRFFNFSFYLLLRDLTQSAKLQHIVRLMFLRAITHDNLDDNKANTENIVTSFPLCSSFKQYQDNSDAYIIHK